MTVHESPVDRSTVDDVLADWPDEPTDIAETIVDRYGLPDEITASRLF